MARERRTMKTANAAFSKSVICTSMLRNSTRQPMGEFGGGGLNLRVCQFVDWIFCQDVENNKQNRTKSDITSKWSLLVVSSWLMVSEKITRGSRMNKCATCLASISSMPKFKGVKVSRNKVKRLHTHHDYEDVERYLRCRVHERRYIRVCWSNYLRYIDQRCRNGTWESCSCLSKARILVSESTTRNWNDTNPQTAFFWCAVIDAASNDIPTAIYISEVTSPCRTSCCQSKLQNVLIHLRITSLKHLRTIIGPTGTRASYMRLASSTLQLWKVSCRQQHPIPKPIASM